MNEDRVYVRFKGKTLGPLGYQKVHDLVRRGQITRMHELSSDGLTWTKAEEFGDFFRQQRAVTTTNVIATANPTPATEITESPSAQNSASRPRAGEPPDDGVEWYAHVGGENRGPFSTGVINQMIASGEVVRETLVWRSGFENWIPALEAFTDRFGVNDATRVSGPGLSTGGDVASEVIDKMLRPRGWILYLSISIFVYAGLSMIYCITTMIVGADVKLLNRGSAAPAVVVGLFGLAINGLIITGGVLLLRYSLCLGVLARRRDSPTALIAMRRLESFWLYSSIVMVILQILFIGGAILLVTIGAAAVDATS